VAKTWMDCLIWKKWSSDFGLFDYHIKNNQMAFLWRSYNSLYETTFEREMDTLDR